MTAAAQRLGLAQPALGAQIKQLEEELGVKLLLRHSRGVEPTSAGRLLHERARSILAEVDRTRLDLRAMGDREQDHLVLGVNPSIVLTLGADLLKRARAEMPDVLVSLVEERTPVLLEALDRGQINVAFLYNIGDRPGLERRAAVEEDLLLVTAPTKEPVPATVSLAEALEHDLVIAGSRGVIRRIVDGEATAPRPAHEARLGGPFDHLHEGDDRAGGRRQHHALQPRRRGNQRAAPCWPAGSTGPPSPAPSTSCGRRSAIPSSTRTRSRGFLDHVVDALLERIGPYARSLR